jgi:hypothetical protein
MLSGATWRAAEMAGTAVFRMVVSSDSMKNATATSHGRRRLEASGWGATEGALEELAEAISVSASTLLPGTRIRCATLLLVGTFPSLFIGGFSVIVYCTQYCAEEF